MISEALRVKNFGRTVTVHQIQRLDRKAIHEIGIPSTVLMENAGRAVAEEVEKTLRRLKAQRVSIVCGTGGNGGDGFVVGRYLIDAGLRPEIFLAGDPRNLRADTAVHYQVLKNLRYPVFVLKEISSPFPETVRRCDLIVDGLFGVGLNREIAGRDREMISAVNEARGFVVSIDIPSGLDGTSGKILGICIRASVTVTFSFAKRGFFLNQGPAHVGRVVVRDIGIPKSLVIRKDQNNQI